MFTSGFARLDAEVFKGLTLRSAWFAALVAVLALVVAVGCTQASQQVATPSPTAPATVAVTLVPSPTIGPTATETSAITVVGVIIPTPKRLTVPTYAPTGTPSRTPTPSATPSPTMAPAPPTATFTSTPAQPPPAPTPQPALVAKPAKPVVRQVPTQVPTPTPSPKPTSTAIAFSTFTPTATPTITPTPTVTPTANPALVSFSPLLIDAVSDMPAEFDFVSDGLSDEEIAILEVADSRLFGNPEFLASFLGPDNWLDEVDTASIQAIPLLMQAIDVQKKLDGKHIIDWEVDSLDKILDDLGIYPGLCTSCYGRRYPDESRNEYFETINNPGHTHRENLKTMAYFAKADGEGILFRSFMENDAGDFEALFRHEHNLPKIYRSSSFSIRKLSFMSQAKLPDGNIESFPTMVYEIIGDAGSQREAAERWFDNFNDVLRPWPRTYRKFEDAYRQYSQTPYHPEPGYVLLEGLAVDSITTSVTVSSPSFIRFQGLAQAIC